MATNNIHTQYILLQQHYMTQQQQFFEHFILGNNNDQRTKQLGDEINVLKMQIQTLTANSNRNQTKVTQEINSLKKENALLKEGVQTIQSEFSFMDSIVENASNNAGEDGYASAKDKEPLKLMLEKMVPQVLEIMNYLML